MQEKLAFLLFVAVTAGALPSTGNLKTQIRHSSDLHGQPSYIMGISPLRTYEESTDFCGEYVETYLAELETKEEEDYILKWIHSEDDVVFVWVGGRWNGNDSYVWGDGQPLRSESWLPGEPSERNEDGRVALVAYNNTMYGFTTFPKTDKHSCLCKR